MSLHLDFEPHSWYMGFAIKRQDLIAPPEYPQYAWIGVTDDGNTYSIVELDGYTLKELKANIRMYHVKHGIPSRLECYLLPTIQQYFEHLRQSLRDENISYQELADLQNLARFIPPDDTELLEAAGVPEGSEL